MAAPAANFDALLPRLDLNSADDLLISLVRALAEACENPEILSGPSEERGVALSQNPALGVLASSLMLDAAYSLRADQGFHGLEYDGSGKSYRWTGPNRAFHFEVMVDRRRPVELCLRYSRMFENPNNEFVRCYVDGIEVETRTVAVGNEFDVLATMSAREDAVATKLTWMCPRVRSPADVGASTDVRKLGLAFRWLKIGNPKVEDKKSASPKPSVAEKILRRALKLKPSRNNAD
jgi:hypothetical protein